MAAYDGTINNYTGQPVEWGTQFKNVKRFPIEANRIFSGKTDMDAYVQDVSASASCIPGIILSVINDPSNNGFYEVYVDNTTTSHLNVRKLQTSIAITGNDLEL